MVLGVRGGGVAWLRPGQGSWSGEDSAGGAKEVSDRRGSELGWARSSEPVSAGVMSGVQPVMRRQTQSSALSDHSKTQSHLEGNIIDVFPYFSRHALSLKLCLAMFF